ncbi:MAG: hypothetical protein AAF653_05085, partial [Chloroflexota bacterium]
RDYIAGELEKRLDRFAAVEKKILKSGGLSMMSTTREAKEKFQTYIAKVKAAAPGYSGLFAAIKLDEQAMERIYAFDEAQVRYVAQFDDVLTNLENAANSGEGLEAAVQAVYNMAQEAMQAFALREDVLTNINKDLGHG